MARRAVATLPGPEEGDYVITYARLATLTIDELRLFESLVLSWAERHPGWLMEREDHHRDGYIVFRVRRLPRGRKVTAP